jgi:hypothetical protein
MSPGVFVKGIQNSNVFGSVCETNIKVLMFSGVFMNRI